MKYCEIKECGATLLGTSYFGVVLSPSETDRGRTIAVCPSCMRKIRVGRKAAA